MIDLRLRLNDRPVTPPAPRPWADIVGFANATWLGSDGHARDQPPELGCAQILRVGAPFAARVAQIIPTIWAPADAWVNGWGGGHDPRLADMLVVEARVERIDLETNQLEALPLRGHSLEALALASLRPAPLAVTLLGGSPIAETTCGDIRHLQFNLEGAAHFEYTLVRDRLVLMRASDTTEDSFWAGCGLPARGRL